MGYTNSSWIHRPAHSPPISLAEVANGNSIPSKHKQNQCGQPMGVGTRLCEV